MVYYMGKLYNKSVKAKKNPVYSSTWNIITTTATYNIYTIIQIQNTPGKKIDNRINDANTINCVGC